MPITSEILSRFLNPTFIETGTFRGDGIVAALVAGFESVLSVEISPELHGKATDRFRTDRRVVLFCGNSAEFLACQVPLLCAPATFWLDAHGYAGVSDPDRPSPLLAELDAIATSTIRTHTILIDDYNIFGRGFRSNVTEAQVRERLLAINPDYLLVRIGTPDRPWDILGALPWK